MKVFEHVSLEKVRCVSPTASDGSILSFCLHDSLLQVVRRPHMLQADFILQQLAMSHDGEKVGLKIEQRLSHGRYVVASRAASRPVAFSWMMTSRTGHVVVPMQNLDTGQA